MNSRRLFLISIAANVALAAVVALLARQRFSPPAPGTGIVVNRIVTNVLPALPATVPVSETNRPPSQFHWSSLESGDYPTYVANLRAVGCPEQTIRDIIIPDIEALYVNKRRALVAEQDFWLNGPTRAAANHERTRQVTELAREEMAAIKSLLGIDWVPNRDSGFLSSASGVFIPYLLTQSLSLEKAKEFAAVLRKYEAQSRQIRSEARNVLLPEDEERLRSMAQQLEVEVTKLVSQTEFDEFKLRVSAVGFFEFAQNLKEANLALSPEELRRIVQFRSVDGNPMSAFSFGLDADRLSSAAERRLAEKETTAKIQSLLGDSRYAAFQLATDDALRSAMRFATQKNLSLPVGRAIYDIQQAAEDRAVELQADSSLTPSQQRRALKEIRTTTEAALTQALGETNMQQYRQRNGRWLTELGRNN